MFLHVGSKDSDQTGRLPRLIWVFAGCTGHFVAFVMLRLNYFVTLYVLQCPGSNAIWAAAQQNQQNEVCLAKTEISLGICLVWSKPSLSAWRSLGSLATHWAYNEDSDQTGWMPRLIWVFAGRTSFCWFCHAAAHIGEVKRITLSAEIWNWTEMWPE